MALTKVTGGVISTSTTINVDSISPNQITIGTGVTLTSSGVNVSGVVTATSFQGDGSQLTGVSGFGTALSNTQGTLLNLVYKTPYSSTVSSGSSVSIESDAVSGYYAYTRLNQIIVSSGATVRVASGTTFAMNVLRF